MGPMNTNVPSEFKKGERLSASKLNQIVQAIVGILRTKPGFGTNHPAEIIGKLDGDLSAATNFGTTYGEAVMSVWHKNVFGNLVDTGRNETVKQRYTDAPTLEAGTEVKARWIEGEWVVDKQSTGGGLTIRFRIVASYFCGACYVDARVISVPFGVSVSSLPDVDTYNNNAVRIYDRTGCKFNEPPEDLVNRIGYATYMTPLEDGPCPDTIFSSWECIDLCCSEETCD